MLSLTRATVLSAIAAAAAAAAGVLALAVPSYTNAQTAARATQTDARWTGWLGCWAGTREGAGEADAAARGQTQTVANATCIVPIAGSAAVEALTIARGKVVSRDRLDASGPAHSINGQGCQGSETVNWSPNGRRAYLRADYTCAGNAGNKGSSVTVFAMTPTGEWLRVEEVRSGGGSTVSVERRHAVDMLAVVPQDEAREIIGEQRAILTARAAAAAPITSDEIIDAVRSLDAGVVRSWVVASDQHFDLDGSELTAMSRADVPQSVLQAVMASGPRSQAYASSDANHSVDQVLNRQVYSPTGPAPAPYLPMTTMYVCPPAGCFGPNAYSPYNGYNAYDGYAPGYAPAYAPGYISPFVSYPLVFGGGFVPFRNGREPFREPPHEPMRPRPPVIPGPVGRRP